MDLCCKWVAVPSGTGCNWVAVPSCWVQSRVWHRCNMGCIGMHKGYMCLRAHSNSSPYLVYSYFVLELGQNGYGHLGRYPLVKPLGSIAPFTGHHPITLLFIYELVD